MKVLLFALTGFGNSAVRALEKEGVKIVAVVTRKELGPFPHYPETDLSNFCKERGIPVLEDVKVRSQEFVETCQGLKPDLVLVSTFHERLPKAVLSMAPKGAVNIHPSLLPKYRGATPTHWALIFGEKETGVSAHWMTMKTDSGGIILQEKLPIERGITDGRLRRRLSALSERVIENLIDRLVSGSPLPNVPQDETEVTYFPRVAERDGLIQFNEPTENIYNRICGTSPYPGAYTYFENEKVGIQNAWQTHEPASGANAGLILRESKEGYLIQTKDGVLGIRLDRPLPFVRGPVVLGPPVQEASVDSPDEIKSRIAHTRLEYGIDADASEFPKMVVLSVAYPCNALCPNCPYTETNSDLRLQYQDAPFIDADLFKKIARECGEYGSFLRITGGGEPMLHPSGMTDLIEYAKSVKAKVWMNTNGSLVTPDRAKRLLVCDTDLVEFSVDAADRETYSVVRAGLDFDTLLQNVTFMLRERKRGKFSTKIVVSVINQRLVEGKMPQIIEFWKNLGVDEVIKRKFLTWGSNTLIDSENSADPTPYLNKETAVPCPFPFHRLNIDTRGKVEVCGYDISGRTNFGNVKKQTIREIWQGPEFEWWRNMHAERRGAEIPLCRECPDWKYRSWKHNWEKVLGTAEAHRQFVFAELESDSSPS